MATLDRPTVEYKTPVDLVRDVRKGQIRVPPFQRGFRWESSDVAKLFDSLYRGYPIGNLLLWRRAAPKQQLNVGPVYIDAPETESALWVVDGQQRITSIVGALITAQDTVDARFRIYLNLDTGAFRSIGARQEPPVFWIAVSLLLDTVTLLRWMRAHSNSLSEAHISLADQAAKAIREYQIPTYVVTSDDEDALVDIFTRMNDTGKPLSKAESFRALHSGLAGKQPTDLRGLGLISADLGFGSLDDRLILRCILAYRGGDIFRDDFHDEFSSDTDRVRTFQDVSNILREVIAFLREDAGVPHIRLLPYSHVIPILVRFTRVHGKPTDRVSALLRRWVWRGAITGARARGISVVDIRHQVFAVDSAAPIDAARNLLGFISLSPGFAPDLNRTNAKHALTKINILGLLSTGPQDLCTAQAIDVRPLLEKRRPLSIIIDDRQIPRSGTMANRIIRSPSTTAVINPLIAAPTEVAASHLITDEAQELLREARYEQFLALRADAVARAIISYVDRMAEWGARDRQAIADIIRSVA